MLHTQITHILSDYILHKLYIINNNFDIHKPAHFNLSGSSILNSLNESY